LLVLLILMELLTINCLNLTRISNDIMSYRYVVFLCSMIWGERWLLVLLILVELLKIILFELSFYNFAIYFNYLNVKALCLIIKKWLKSVMSRRQLRNVDIWLLRCNSQLYYGVCLCCLN
jgi:hypothetical protein